MTIQDTIAAAYQHRTEHESDIRGHLSWIHRRAAQPGRAVNVIELGVRGGNSTAALLAAVQLNPNSVMVSVDIEDPVTPVHWAWHPQWTFLLGDDTDPAVFAAVTSRVLAADLLFIDTSHTYDHTLAELRLYGPLVRPGGVILLHDTLTTVLGEEGWPVTRAISAWTRETGHLWVNRTGYHGLGVITINPGVTNGDETGR